MQKYQKERHFKTAYTYVFLGILQIFRQNIKKDRHKK